MSVQWKTNNVNNKSNSLIGNGLKVNETGNVLEQLDWSYGKTSTQGKVSIFKWWISN